ncbi:MFS transporter [Microbacter margulisiae]|uniref:MFS family permease n=1 Tax=Microbacter margulisiae TaxID=1350067 RepID=A0A7W5DSK9_9PORP|nr:MFS transporter [Microbacter margulisiae]MBB3187483.1 MFS family permease [Microbacter margulisiae]
MNIGTFRAFRNPNYRLYFTGQSISLIGTWMQRTAVYWVVFDQTNSNFMLGLVVFATQFPSFLFSPLGGIAIDRYNRYRLTLLTQAALLVQAGLLASMVLFTHYTVWGIFILSIVQGIINAFDLPARQSLVNEIIDNKENLANAIALNSSMGKLAWLIGPAVSGIVLDKFGAGICFLINALSYLAVITALAFIKVSPYIPQPRSRNAFVEIKEGFRYVINTPSLRTTILLLACVSLLVLPFYTLLPAFAKVVFRGNAATYGYLNSMIGTGSLTGAIALASLKSSKLMMKILFASLLILGIALIAFSHLTLLPVALFFLAIAGFAMMFQTTVSQTIIQLEASGEMLGRTLSFFMMAFFGLQPVGGLLIGAVSELTGVANAILFQGICAVIITILFGYFLRRNKL